MNNNTQQEKQSKQLPVLRIGFLGAANICKKNAYAIHNKSSNCKWTAIASRSSEKAKHFISDCIEKNALLQNEGNDMVIFDSYDDLIQSEDVVDAVYIPLPTTLHKEWVIKCLEANKHVLLEKPVALSHEDFTHMIQIAKSKHTFLMDGTMFIHNTRTQSFLNAIPSSISNTSTKKNDIKEIKTEFTFLGDESFWKSNIRLLKECDPFGCIGDLGWYCIRMALVIMNEMNIQKQPTSAQVTHVKCNDDGVPIDATCLVYFDDILCSFHCSFLQESTDIVEVYDTNQTLIAKINKFVIPPKDTTLTYDIIRNNHNDTTTTSSMDTREIDNTSFQEVLMWKKFSIMVESMNSCNGWNEEALEMVDMSFKNQKIIDALMESISCDGKVVLIS